EISPQSLPTIVCLLTTDRQSTSVTPLASFLTIPPPPSSTLFPYTTLFRSLTGRSAGTPLRRAPDRDPDFRARRRPADPRVLPGRSEEHTSELQSPCNLVCRLLLEKKKNNTIMIDTECMR